MHREPSFKHLWGDRPLAPTALLTDGQIQEAVEQLHVLIDPEVSYDRANAVYCSYEVHASGDVGTVDYLSNGEGLREHRASAHKITIRPGATVRLFTAESFLLPPDVFALVIGLGQLYAAGVTIGSTYVDPGTRNHVYLSVSNVSDREVIIPIGFPIGRAQFFVMGTEADHLKRGDWRDIPYETGATAPLPATVEDLDQVRSQVKKIENSLHDNRAAIEPTTNALQNGEWSNLRQALAQQRWINTLLFTLIVALAAVSLPEGFWTALSGDGLPPILRFVIPAIAGGVLFHGVTWLIDRLRARNHTANK